MDRDDETVIVLTGGALHNLAALAKLHNLPEIPITTIVIEPSSRLPGFDKNMLAPLADRGYRDSAPRSPKQRFRKSSKRT